LARAGDGDVLCVLECIIGLMLTSPSPILQGNPRSFDDGDASISFPPWGINLGGVDRRKGPVEGFLEEGCCF
jgi:hypothetical protein